MLILSTGLFLNNADTIQNVWFRSIFLYKNLSADLSQLYQLSAESAFILRTFFFVIFGFTMNIHELNDLPIIGNGLFILASIYVIRIFFLKIFKKDAISPILYIAPRGLISILLYFNLPPSLKIPEVGTSFLFLVVLGSSLVMTLGIALSKGKAEESITV